MRLFYTRVGKLVIRDESQGVQGTGFTVIESKQGVHQGDPMSMFAHAIAQHILLREAQVILDRPENGGRVMSYSDDTWVLAPAHAATAATQFLARGLPRIGAEAQLAKSLVYSDNFAARMEVSDALAVPPADSLWDDQEQRAYSGVKVAGIPVGSDRWELHYLDEAARSADKLLEFLPSLQDAQLEYLLL